LTIGFNAQSARYYWMMKNVVKTENESIEGLKMIDDIVKAK
jgi:hypothetical protein